MERLQRSPKTITRRLTSLRGFARWAGLVNPLSDYIAPKPARGIPHPLPEGIAGIEKMIGLAKNYEQVALLSLCGYAGLRIGEALSAQADWFDIESMLATVRGKGDKTRVIPLSTRAWDGIAPAYIMAAGTDKNLINYKDRFARKIVTNLGVRAKLARPISSHDLRATFATHVYDLTNDLRLVQDLLGHSQSTTTEVYTGIGISKMRSAVDF